MAAQEHTKTTSPLKKWKIRKRIKGKSLLVFVESLALVGKVIRTTSNVPKYPILTGDYHRVRP